jgi:hypothetical protein
MNITATDATEVSESHNEIFERLQGRKVFLDAAREDKAEY